MNDSPCCWDLKFHRSVICLTDDHWDLRLQGRPWSRIQHPFRGAPNFGRFGWRKLKEPPLYWKHPPFLALRGMIILESSWATACLFRFRVMVEVSRSWPGCGRIARPIAPSSNTWQMECCCEVSCTDLRGLTVLPSGLAGVVGIWRTDFQLVGGLEHFLFSHILGIPTSQSWLLSWENDDSHCFASGRMRFSPWFSDIFRETQLRNEPDMASYSAVYSDLSMKRRHMGVSIVMGWGYPKMDGFNGKPH